MDVNKKKNVEKLGGCEVSEKPSCAVYTMEQGERWKNIAWN